MTWNAADNLEIGQPAAQRSIYYEDNPVEHFDSIMTNTGGGGTAPKLKERFDSHQSTQHYQHPSLRLKEGEEEGATADYSGPRQSNVKE